MPEVLDINGAGEGNRTLVFSLEGCCSTIELHPRDRNRGNPGVADGDELTRPAGGLNTPSKRAISPEFGLEQPVSRPAKDP